MENKVKGKRPSGRPRHKRKGYYQDRDRKKRRVYWTDMERFVVVSKFWGVSTTEVMWHMHKIGKVTNPCVSKILKSMI